MRMRNVLFAVGIATVAMLGGLLSRPLTAQITRQGLPLAGACRHDNETSQISQSRTSAIRVISGFSRTKEGETLRKFATGATERQLEGIRPTGPN